MSAQAPFCFRPCPPYRYRSRCPTGVCHAVARLTGRRQHTGPCQWSEARLSCEPISPDTPQGFKFQKFGVGGIIIFYGRAARPPPGVGGPASRPSARGWGAEGKGPTLSRVAFLIITYPGGRPGGKERPSGRLFSIPPTPTWDGHQTDTKRTSAQPFPARPLFLLVPKRRFELRTY